MRLFGIFGTTTLPSMFVSVFHTDNIWKQFVSQGVLFKSWKILGANFFLSSHLKCFLALIPVTSHSCCFLLMGCGLPVLSLGTGAGNALFKKREKRALITQVSTEKNCDVVPDGCICEAECSQKESGRRQGKCENMTKIPSALFHQHWIRRQLW